MADAANPTWINAGLILTRNGRCLALCQNLDDRREIDGHAASLFSPDGWEKLANLLVSLQKFSANSKRGLVQFRSFDVALADDRNILVAIIYKRGIAQESIHMKALQVIYTFSKLYKDRIQEILIKEKEEVDRMLNEYTVQNELVEKRKESFQTMPEFDDFQRQYFRPILSTPPYDWFWLWYVTSQPSVLRAMIVDSNSQVLISSRIAEGTPFKQGLLPSAHSSIWGIISSNVQGMSKLPAQDPAGQEDAKEKELIRTLEFSSVDGSLVLFVTIRMIRIPGNGCLVVFSKKDRESGIKPAGTMGFKMVSQDILSKNVLESINGTARTISRHFPTTILSIPAVPHRPVGHKTLRQYIQDERKSGQHKLQTHSPRRLQSHNGAVLLSPSRASFPYALFIDQPHHPTVIPLHRRTHVSHAQGPVTPISQKLRNKSTELDDGDILESSFFAQSTPESMQNPPEIKEKTYRIPASGLISRDLATEYDATSPSDTNDGAPNQSMGLPKATDRRPSQTQQGRSRKKDKQNKDAPTQSSENEKAKAQIQQLPQLKQPAPPSRSTSRSSSNVAPSPISTTATPSSISSTSSSGSSLGTNTSSAKSDEIHDTNPADLTEPRKPHPPLAPQPPTAPPPPPDTAPGFHRGRKLRIQTKNLE